jgi:hypothetical protein
MKNGYRPIFERLIRTCAGGLAPAFLILLNAVVVAQSSVEKAETSQQTRAPESELERARAIVAKPGENKPVKPETGRTWGVYSTTTSFEIGHRFVDADGSVDRYLSDVNVRDGFRLLDFSTEMRAQPGAGLLFDFMKADASNLGGDQSQTISLRMDKTRVYRFDGNVRRFNYFRSPGPNFALGFRNSDVRQQVSDFNLKLFPQRAVRINAGYGRSLAKGRYNPSYSFERDLFQLLGETRWEANDYRLGIDATWRRWSFGVEQFYRNFRNDPNINSRPGIDPGANLGTPPPVGAISFLDREIPLRARTLVTRANVQGSVGDRLHIVLRGLHDDERMKAPYLETVRGTASNNGAILSRVLTGNGTVERPGDVVDAGATFDINKNFSISDSFRYTSFRIAGDMSTLQTSLQQSAPAPAQTIITTAAGDRLTKWTSYWNTLSLDMNFGRKFSANLGWRAMQREVRLAGDYVSRVSAPPSVTTLSEDESESVTTNAFVGGFRVRPNDKLSFIFDVEHGTNNNAFVRINPLEFTRFRARTQVHITDKLSISGAFTSTNRTNPTPQVENESDARSYTAAVNWEPTSRVYLDVGYDYHNLFATANIRYFVAGSQERRGDSLYYARLNSIFANARFGLSKRLDLLMVYYYIMDRGAPTVALGPNDLVSSFPLRRHNPEVRLAYRFSNSITGNLSYRHYSYNERDFAVQDYRANILTTSLRFTF